LENNNSIKALDNFNYFSINPLFFEYWDIYYKLFLTFNLLSA
jgi:hypothetical protein